MLDDTTLDELLSLYPVLHALPATLQHTLRQSTSRQPLAAEQVLFNPRDGCRALPLLLSGSLRVTHVTRAGRELLLYRVMPGDSCILTVSCLLAGDPYQAHGSVEQAGTAVWLPAPLFMQCIEQSESFRRHVFRFLNHRLSELIVRIEEVGFQRLDQRLAARLLDSSPNVGITHRMLADDLGTVREVVSRLLQEFRDLGAVEVARGHIRILDRARLEQIARG